MPTTPESVVKKHLHSGSPAQRTREEYATTLRKWSRWGGAVSLERLGRKEILHLLGLDHEKLTYRYGGRDFRLTDVHGNVVHEMMD